ncbi:MAG: flagellar assembly protein FliH [Peptococcaceae bacterium]|jgi:flagellar assembly protein FliH|nr:flagellar assembly protein FliH [Peptococcaceae bacterium]
MKLFTNSRIVKNGLIEVAQPRLIDFDALEFTLFAREETREDHQEEAVAAEEEEGRKLTAIREELVLKASEQADHIIATAESEASRLLQEAREKAEQLLEQAREGVERLREEVRQETRLAVYPQYQETGYQDGLQAAQTETREKLEQAAQCLALAQKAVRLEFEKQDAVLLQLAKKMAERILRGSLAIEPERLLQIVRALSLLPRDREGWYIHVAPSDAEMLAALDDQALAGISWAADETLERGDCYLTCSEGLFDARLHVQLDRMEQLLKEELEKKKGSTDGEVDGAGGEN